MSSAFLRSNTESSQYVVFTLEQVKEVFDTEKCQYTEEYTFGNYDDEGNSIEERIPTLTTKFCEIGLYGETLYLVYIGASDSWSQDFYTALQQAVPEVQVYGLQAFRDNYNVTKQCASEIRSEPYFQLQCNFKIDTLSIEEFMHTYDSINRIFTAHNITVLDQLHDAHMLTQKIDSPLSGSTQQGTE